MNIEQLYHVCKSLFASAELIDGHVWIEYRGQKIAVCGYSDNRMVILQSWIGSDPENPLRPVYEHYGERVFIHKQSEHAWAMRKFIKLKNNIIRGHFDPNGLLAKRG